MHVQLQRQLLQHVVNKDAGQFENETRTQFEDFEWYLTKPDVQ